MCSDRPVDSPRRAVRSRAWPASASCRETSTSIANSLPRLAIRLSLMDPPQSEITRVRSWTIPVRSLPMADTARCCFIWRECTAGGGLRTRSVRPYHARPFLSNPRISHVRRQPGGARDPDAAGRQYRFRRLVASPRIPRREWHHRHRRRRFHRRIRHGHRRRTARAAGRARAARSANGRISSRTPARAAPPLPSNARAGFSALDIDALLVATPAYVRPTQEGLFRHFSRDRRRIAPSRASLQRAGAHRGRHAAGDRRAAVARAAHRGHKGSGGRSRASPRAGRDLRFRSSRCCRATISPRARPSGVGAAGVISVTANVAPRAMADMVAAAVRGERAVRHADRPAPGGPASQPVRRVQSHSREMGRGPHGSLRRYSAAAADRTVGGVPCDRHRVAVRRRHSDS